MDAGENGVTEQLLGHGRPEERQGGRVEVGEPHLDAHEDGGCRTFDHPPEAIFALAQRRLGQLAFGDIVHDCLYLPLPFQIQPVQGDLGGKRCSIRPAVFPFENLWSDREGQIDLLARLFL